MKSNIPNVVIVGRPNVGKSTLFNRLLKKKISIVSDEEGTTRDRIIFPCVWNKRTFNIIDTGGYRNKSADYFQEDINKQVDFAIDFADLIVFVTSIKEGPTKEDLILISKLKKTEKKIIIVANKADTKNELLSVNVFATYGISSIIGLSSIHGFGIIELLDNIVKTLSFIPNTFYEESFKLAIIGKPNVGKSSLVNALVNEYRVIVSERPGTTRDSIDTDIVFKENKYTLIDTAGIKRNKASLSDIEFYSELRSNMSIERAKVVLLMVDHNQEITHIDESIMAHLKETHKPTIILINKSESLNEDKKKEILKDLEYKFKFASYSTKVFISAKTKKNLPKIFEEIEKLKINLNQQISKRDLNKFIQDLQILKQPPRQRGTQVKITYITYFNDVYPQFVIYSNRPDLIHFSYKRFIENQLRNVFNFEGIPFKVAYKVK